MRAGRTGELACPACQAREWEARRREEWLAEAPVWARGVCIASGMSPQEAQAEVARIPLQIKKALPEDAVKALLAGQDPAHGFGLGGEGTGAGKTSAMAAILQGWMRAREEQRVRAGGEPPESGAVRGPGGQRTLAWASWPSTVSMLRTRATVDGFVEDTLARLIGARVLFLDDLGSERIKGSYVEDFAASQLDVVVDERYRDERPSHHEPGLHSAWGLLRPDGQPPGGDNPLSVVEASLTFARVVYERLMTGPLTPMNGAGIRPTPKTGTASGARGLQHYRGSVRDGATSAPVAYAMAPGWG